MSSAAKPAPPQTEEDLTLAPAAAAEAEAEPTPPPPPLTEEEKEAAKQPSSLHDIYILGIFTSAVADGWRGLVTSYPPDEVVDEEFKKMDEDKDGKINKNDVVRLLRAIGKSERQTQRLADSVESETMDIEEFTALVHPAKYPCVDSYNVAKPIEGSCGVVPAVPVPFLNYDKLWDVPVLGNTISTVGHIIAEPMDNYSRRLYRSEKPTCKQLAETFRAFDTDSDGKLNKQDLELALRVRAMTEAEITAIVDDEMLPKDGTCLYDYKKMVRGPKYVPGSMNCIPVLGGPVHTYIIGDDGIPDEDMREVFEHVAQGKPTLDKEAMKEALAELGKSDHQISCFIPDDETKASYTVEDLIIMIDGEPECEEAESKVKKVEEEAQPATATA